MMIVTSGSIAAFAENDAEYMELEPEIFELSDTEITEEDNDELLMEYLEQEVSEELAAETGAGSGNNMLKARKATRGSRLTGVNLAMYNSSVEMANSIAAGETASSVVNVPLRPFLTKYYKSDTSE